jgi:hypothetical protein
LARLRQADGQHRRHLPRAVAGPERNRVVFHDDEYAMMQTGRFQHGRAGT